MQRLNYFTPFESKAPNHEDQLTRAFLVLIRFIPLFSIGFFEKIREKLVITLAIDNKTLPDGFPSILHGNAELDIIATQTSSVPTDDVTDLVALMITDQKWTPDKYKIKKRKGRARYDGVIKAGSFVFTIENKPHHEAINPIQLDPDLEEDVSINLDHPPVVLYWEELISQLTSFLTKGLFSRNEEMLVEDFLEYAQTYFWFINPFDKLSICKNDKRLVNFRCHKLMEEIVGDDAARYHRGAGYYIPIRPGAVKQVWIGVDFENKNDPRFYIDMYPGDTLNQARYFFSKLDRDRLARFLDENKKNVLIDRNLHFSFMATNLVWCDVQIDTEAYITYWNERIHTLGQISRDAKGSFRYYIDQLKHDGMISESDIEKLTDHFEDSRRQTMTPCPGMFIRFSWSLDEATSMDKEEGRLALEARKIIDELLAIWGQTFQPDMQ